MLNKSFDDLLNEPCFVGYLYDCAIGTAVIGAEKENKFIKDMLDMYEDSTKGQPNHIECDYAHTNNYYFTWHIINKYPEFKMNNVKQDLKDLIIYPKEFFEIGDILGKYYSRHLCDQSWKKKDGKDSIKKIIIRTLKQNKYVWIIFHKITIKHVNKTTVFYQYAVTHNKI